MPPTSRVPCLAPNTPGPNVARAYFAPTSIPDRPVGMAPPLRRMYCRVRSLRSQTPSKLRRTFYGVIRGPAAAVAFGLLARGPTECVSRVCGRTGACIVLQIVSMRQPLI